MASFGDIFDRFGDICRKNNVHMTPPNLGRQISKCHGKRPSYLIKKSLYSKFSKFLSKNFWGKMMCTHRHTNFLKINFWNNAFFVKDGMASSQFLANHCRLMPKLAIPCHSLPYLYFNISEVIKKKLRNTQVMKAI